MFLSQLKHKFNHKVVIISFALTSIWLIHDFTERFITTVQVSDTQRALNITEQYRGLAISNTEKEHILNLYEQYRIESNDENDESDAEGILTAEQQAQQQGLLEQVYIGENKYELKAVIATNTAKTSTLDKKVDQKPYKTALLQITHLKTGAVALEEFPHNSNVDGFVLTIEQNTQVTLTRNLTNEITKSQKIILSMYQTNKS